MGLPAVVWPYREAVDPYNERQIMRSVEAFITKEIKDGAHGKHNIE